LEVNAREHIYRIELIKKFDIKLPFYEWIKIDQELCFAMIYTKNI